MRLTEVFPQYDRASNRSNGHQVDVKQVLIEGPKTGYSLYFHSPLNLLVMALLTAETISDLERQIERGDWEALRGMDLDAWTADET